MADPLETLRLPVTPVDPEPAFARRLRAGVERALARPGGPAVSSILTEAGATTPHSGAALTHAASSAAAHGVVPFLAVADGRSAIDWYVEALGAELHGEPMVMPDGRIGHSELWLAGGPFHVADESPASHVAAPRPEADATVTLGAEVADVDAAIGRAVERGATLERAAADHPYGRNAVIRDPFGHRWLISSAAVLDRVRTGDVAYASLWVPDVERAAAFFADVLGWRYAPGSSGQGRQVVGTRPAQGLWGGERQATLFLSYYVDDLQAAVARVRRAGGQTDAPRRAPYGYTADCVDDQGARFALLEIPSGTPPPRTSLTGQGHGTLAFISMQVVDSARARAFYGAVLGWDFTVGNWDDGWNVLAPVPMTGMVGGRDRAANVAVFEVDDVEAAAQRVRAASGTASVPSRRPFGLMSDCLTPDGLAFNVWRR